MLRTTEKIDGIQLRIPTIRNRDALVVHPQRVKAL